MVVSLTSSEGHYDGVQKALRSIEKAIVEKLEEAKTIMIKPNFVSSYRELSATPVESVKALLDFIYSNIGEREIVIAEGVTIGSFDVALKNYDYLKLKNSYNIRFVNLNTDNFAVFKVYDRSLKKNVKVRVAKTALESDFKISICRPKTHDTVVVTLSIKNLVMGAIQLPYKRNMHQGYGPINLNIALMARYLMPELAIIDGYVGMEGSGPVGGDPVRWKVALAGVNPLEVDALTAWLMGFSPLEVGYIYLLHEGGWGNIDIDRIETVGEEPARFRRKFRPHPTYHEQLRWMDMKEILVKIFKKELIQGTS